MASAREVISPDGICLLPLLIGLLQITLFNIDSASSLLPLNFFFFQILHRTNYPLLSLIFVFIQSPSHVWLFMTPWTATCQASLSLTISQSLPKIMSIELVLSSNHLILSSPIYPLPSIFTSIRAFSNEITVCIRWPKYWNFSISPSNEYSRLISFKIDWFDLLPVQETLKSLLQHQFESINSLVLSLLYCPTVKSVPDYWKNHSFDCTELCWQSDVSFF